MPTVYERLEKFYQYVPSFKFSKKKTREIGNAVKNNWSKIKNPPPLTYQNSIEKAGTYEVRVYPEKYSGQIDKIIFSFYANHQKNIEAAEKKLSHRKPQKNIKPLQKPKPKEQKKFAPRIKLQSSQTHTPPTFRNRKPIQKTSAEKIDWRNIGVNKKPQ